MALKPNLPTSEGRALGTELARLCDGEARSRPEEPDRCRTCAFRAGTAPNGCVPTLMDALKCAMEGVPFYCHESPCGEPTRLCAGWRLMLFRERCTAPWEFSG